MDGERYSVLHFKDYCMKRFHNFLDLIQYCDSNIPDACAFLYDDLKTCTYHRFYQEVLSEAERLKQTHKTCIGILNDGTFESIKMIFASNIAGLQVVMMDALTEYEKIQTLIDLTDIDLLWPEDDTFSFTSGIREKTDQILFFTSGTTDRNKAVVLTSKTLMSSAFNGGMMLPLKQEDKLMCMLPLSHVFGFVCSLLWGLSFGSTICLSRGVRHYIDDMSYFKPTVLSAVPSLLSFLFQHELINPECKLILVGAGDCRKELLESIQEKNIQISFGYGLTETSSGVAISTSGDPYAMSICPDDTITLAEDNEILIKAPTCMFKGYYKDSQSTDQVLKDDILYTGDLGRFDEEGKLHITGRKKEMLVLSSGTKIFLPEYEKEIMQRTGLNDIAVILHNDKVTLVYHGTTDIKTIREMIHPVMYSYTRDQQIQDIIQSKIPLPRTALGKIQRWRIQI